MNTAAGLADKSKQSLVAACDVEQAGGFWSRKNQAYIFPDGSRGVFVKQGPTLTADKRFSHYRFEEVA